MSRKIFINLAVNDLEKSTNFATKALGFSITTQAGDDRATSLSAGEDISIMLVTKEFFKTLTKKPACDATQGNEAIICLTCESREAVDTIARNAIAAGAKSGPDEPEDHGFMYSHGFEDPDGHVWNFMYMEPTAAE